MWVPFILMSVVQTSALILFGNLPFNVNLGNLAAMAVMVICLAVAVTGIGLALTMLIRSVSQGLVVTQLITLGGALLGGLWVSTDGMPGIAQLIGKFTRSTGLNMHCWKLWLTVQGSRMFGCRG